jgi:hypothetical protein
MSVRRRRSSIPVLTSTSNRERQNRHPPENSPRNSSSALIYCKCKAYVAAFRLRQGYLPITHRNVHGEFWQTVAVHRGGTSREKWWWELWRFLLALNEFSRADIVTLGDILCGYIQHPEIKSLGPSGEKCKIHTRGLLRRMASFGLSSLRGTQRSRTSYGQRLE